MKHILIQILCFLLLISMVGCGQEQGEAPVTTAAPSTVTTAPAEDQEYPYYGDNDFGNYEFRILNYDSYVETNLRFAPEESSESDLLDSAMFKRNTLVEDKLNISIVEDRKGYSDLGGWGGQQQLGLLVYNSVFSGSYQWDVANVFPNWSPTLITDGMLMDLNAIEQLQLDEDYWDTDIMKEISLKGKCYAASGKLTLMPFDLTWCLFFNEDMMVDLGLEKPYSLVDDMQWTMEKMFDYVKAGTKTGSGGTHDYENDATAICGVATHESAPAYFVFAGGNPFMKINEKGDILSNIQNERIYNTIELVQDMFSASNGYSNLGVSRPSDPTASFGYLGMFVNDRALFVAAEVKSASKFRAEMDSTYGVLPIPMYDTAQGRYHSPLGAPAMIVVPNLQENLARTGLILDAMAYESTPVMDLYYNQIVTHRNVTNPESERMINLVHDTLSVEFGMFYSFTNHYMDTLQKAIVAESANPAGMGETEADTIDLRVEKFLESLNKEATADS